MTLKKDIKYWHLKEEALDRTAWGTSFGRGYAPDARLHDK
jgi:hypothetical protein